MTSFLRMRLFFCGRGWRDYQVAMGIIIRGSPLQVNKCVGSSGSQVAETLGTWGNEQYWISFILVQERNAFVSVLDSFDFCGQNAKTIVHSLFFGGAGFILRLQIIPIWINFEL